MTEKNSCFYLFKGHKTRDKKLACLEFILNSYCIIIMFCAIKERKIKLFLIFFCQCFFHLYSNSPHPQVTSNYEKYIRSLMEKLNAIKILFIKYFLINFPRVDENCRCFLLFCFRQFKFDVFKRI